MIAQSFYTLGSISADIEDYNLGEINDFVVCKHGKLLNSLDREDDVIYTIMATPATTIVEENSDTMVLHNAVFENRQALTPSLIESIINTDKEDIYTERGILFKWAFEHQFKSTLLHYFDKYPTSRKYIDKLIYKYLGRFSYNDLIIFLIDRYHYDITKDGNKLFATAFSFKNDYLCRYLIEKKGAMIPSLLYKISMTCGKRNGNKDMYELFQEYSDKVDLG